MHGGRRGRFPRLARLGGSGPGRAGLLCALAAVSMLGAALMRAPPALREAPLDFAEMSDAAARWPVPPRTVAPPPAALLVSPSVAVLPDGAAVMCHGVARGGPGAPAEPLTRVLGRGGASAGGGWAPRGEVRGVVGASLVAAPALAMLGFTPGGDAAVVLAARAPGDGSDWSAPQTVLRPSSGRVFSCAASPLAVHDGRVWAAVTEVPAGGDAAGVVAAVRVLSGGASGNLGSAAAWSAVPGAPGVPDPAQVLAMPGGVPGVRNSFSWGAAASAVPAPGGGVAVLAPVASGARDSVAVRFATLGGGGGGGGAPLAYDRMVTLPGAHAPFAARYHAPSGYYVALTNARSGAGAAVEPPVACYSRPNVTAELRAHLGRAGAAEARRHREALREASGRHTARARATRGLGDGGDEWGVPHPWGPAHLDAGGGDIVEAEEPGPPLPCCAAELVTRECSGRCVWCRARARSSLWLVVSRDLAQWRAVERVAMDVSPRAGSWASDALFGVQSADFCFAGAGGAELLAVAAVAEDNARANDWPLHARAYAAAWLEATLRTAPPDELLQHRRHAAAARAGDAGQYPPLAARVDGELAARVGGGGGGGGGGGEGAFESAAVVGLGEKLYPGSPCLVRLGDATVLTHDVYGGSSPEELRRYVATYVRRRDPATGRWPLIARVPGLYWATAFEVSAQPGVLWLLGTDGLGSRDRRNNVTASVSRDGGVTWAAPRVVVATREGWLSTAATSAIEEGGRVWRAMERYVPPVTTWATGARLFVLSAPVGADLLDPASWSVSADKPWPRLALPGTVAPGLGPSSGYLEANMVRRRGGGAAMMVRVNSTPRPGLAAVVAVPTPGHGLAPAARPGGSPIGAVSIVPFPGGHSKFAVRLHEPSGYYVALSSATDRSTTVDFFPGCYNSPRTQREVRDRFSGAVTGSKERLWCCRNNDWRFCPRRCMWCRDQSRARLWLLVSRDLAHWRPVEELLSDRTSLRGTWMSDLFTGFQYPDFIFDGPGGGELLAAVRTAEGDTERMHDSTEIRLVRSRWLERARATAPAGEEDE